MDKKAIGLLECRSIAQGIEAADTMVKTAGVDLLQATPVCPGKFIVIIGGMVSAVNSSIEAGRSRAEDTLIDSFVLANVHEAVFPALSGATDISEPEALGIIETFSVASAIVAADTAVKAAGIELLDIRIARGMGGKSYVLMNGDIGSVSAAVDSVKGSAQDGLLVAASVIPRPDPQIWKSII